MKHDSDSAAVPSRDAWEFSQAERALLLRLAHDSILSAIEKREIPIESPSAHLAEPRGVFTSLYFRGELRGCVGFVLPKDPLCEQSQKLRGLRLSRTRVSIPSHCPKPRRWKLNSASCLRHS